MILPLEVRTSKMVAKQQGYRSIALADKQMNKWCIQPPLWQLITALLHSEDAVPEKKLLGGKFRLTIFCKYSVK